MLDRRVEGFPLEQVLGWAEFCGLQIAVEPGIFVPRRRTEFLVQQAVALVRGAGDSHIAGRAPVVVDLCCGSGAVAAAIAAQLTGVELHAADIEPSAVRCARGNLRSAGAVHEGDLYDALPVRMKGRVDAIVANAPYVPTAEISLMPPEARDHEPRAALDGGADGLDVVRRVIEGAPAWLAHGGSVLVETSPAQLPQLTEIAERNGLTPRVASCDDLAATVVVATAIVGAGGS
jgi:release factor glutamine methyltransferase